MPALTEELDALNEQQPATAPPTLRSATIKAGDLAHRGVGMYVAPAPTPEAEPEPEELHDAMGEAQPSRSPRSLLAYDPLGAPKPELPAWTAVGGREGETRRQGEGETQMAPAADSFSHPPPLPLSPSSFTPPRARMDTERPAVYDALMDREQQLFERDQAALARQRDAEARATKSAQTSRNVATRRVLKQAGIPGIEPEPEPDGTVGDVTPVTDATGAPLTQHDPRHNVAYDSAGNALELRVNPETGVVETRPAMASAQRMLDPKTGDVYDIRSGLPWQWVTADDSVRAQLDQKRRSRLDAQAAAALSAPIAEARAAYREGQKATRQSSKALETKFAELGLPLPTDTAAASPSSFILQPSSLPSLRAAIETATNQEFAAPSANASPIFGGGRYTPVADALRADIQKRKETALAAVNDHAGLVEAFTQSKNQLATLLQQQSHLRTGRLEEVNAQRVAAGLPEVGIRNASQQGDRSGDQQLAPGNGGVMEYGSDVDGGPTTPTLQNSTTPPPTAAEDVQTSPPTEGESPTQSPAPSLYDRATNFLKSLVGGAASATGDIYQSPLGDVGGVQKTVDLVSRLSGHAEDHVVAHALQKVPGVITDPAFHDNGEAKAGRFIGGMLPWLAQSAVAPQATIPLLFSTGFQGQVDAAREHGADEGTALRAGLLGGAVNSVLGIPFGGAGKVISSMFGKAAPSAVEAAFNRAYAAEGGLGVANLLSAWKAAVENSGIIPEAFRDAASTGLAGVIREISRTTPQRVLGAAGTALRDAGLFAGAQAGQNVVTRTYNPDQPLGEGVGESAVGGLVMGGLFGGLREAKGAKVAKLAGEDISKAMKRGEPPAPGAEPAPGPEGTEPPAGGPPAPLPPSEGSAPAGSPAPIEPLQNVASAPAPVSGGNTGPAAVATTPEQLEEASTQRVRARYAGYSGTLVKEGERWTLQAPGRVVEIPHEDIGQVALAGPRVRVTDGGGVSLNDREYSNVRIHQDSDGLVTGVTAVDPAGHEHEINQPDTVHRIGMALANAQERAAIARDPAAEPALAQQAQETLRAVPTFVRDAAAHPLLNRLADVFDTGDSKIGDPSSRRFVRDTPEFHRQLSDAELDRGERIAIGVIDQVEASAISDTEKHDLAEPFYNLWEEINEYKTVRQKRRGPAANIDPGASESTPAAPNEHIPAASRRERPDGPENAPADAPSVDSPAAPASEVAQHLAAAEAELQAMDKKDPTRPLVMMQVETYRRSLAAQGAEQPGTSPSGTIPGIDERTPAPAKKPDKKLASTQFNITGADAAPIRDFIQSIPDSDLYTDTRDDGTTGKGREVEPHLTAFYGLKSDDIAQVSKAVQGHGPVAVTLGKVSVFSNPDKPYDALKVDVQGEGLHALNAKLRGLPNESTFPDYKPHITLAYVKKGTGAKYAGDTRFEGQTINLPVLTHSTSERVHTPIALEASKAVTKTTDGVNEPQTLPTSIPGLESPDNIPGISNETPGTADASSPRPRLGDTVDEVVAKWKEATHDPEQHGNSESLVGKDVAGGKQFQWGPQDDLRVLVHKGGINGYRSATAQEELEMREDIARGGFQIERQQVRGMDTNLFKRVGAGQTNAVLHQATGRPLGAATALAKPPKRQVEEPPGKPTLDNPTNPADISPSSDETDTTHDTTTVGQPAATASAARTRANEPRGGGGGEEGPGGGEVAPDQSAKARRESGHARVEMARAEVRALEQADVWQRARESGVTLEEVAGNTPAMEESADGRTVWFNAAILADWMDVVTANGADANAWMEQAMAEAEYHTRQHRAANGGTRRRYTLVASALGPHRLGVVARVYHLPPGQGGGAWMLATEYERMLWQLRTAGHFTEETTGEKNPAIAELRALLEGPQPREIESVMHSVERIGAGGEASGPAAPGSPVFAGAPRATPADRGPPARGSGAWKVVPSSPSAPRRSNQHPAAYERGDSLFAGMPELAQWVKDKMSNGTLTEEDRDFVGPVLPRGVIAFGKRIYQGIADNFRDIGVSKLAEAAENADDEQRKIDGMAKIGFRRLDRELGRKRFSAAARVVKEYRENMDHHPDEAMTLRARLSPDAARIVDLQEEVLDRFGDYAERVGLMVQDDAGHWRKFKKRANYYPRMMDQRLLNAIRNPAANPKDFRRAGDIYLEWSKDGRKGFAGELTTDPETKMQFAGQIPVLDTLEDVLRYTQPVRTAFEQHGAIRNGNLEHARTLPQPNKLYDYGMEAFERYINNSARRLAQVRHFGQSVPGVRKDLFETTLERVHDSRTSEYIERARDVIYGKKPRDGATRTMALLNNVATLTQLTNPVTSIGNLLGGVTDSAHMYGVRNTLKGIWALRHAADVIDEAYEKGILSADLMAMAHDSEEYGSTMVEKTGKFAQWSLRMAGYNSVEEFNRGVSMMAGKALLREGFRATAKNPEGRAALSFRDYLEKSGVSPEKILAEQGSGLETDKFLRKTVNESQGGYTPAQTTLLSNTPVGAFLLKYQRWGTQHTRFVMRRVIGPAMDFIRSKGARGSMIPVFRYLLLTALTGAALVKLKDYLFGTPDPSATLEEIQRTATTDQLRAITLGAQKIWKAQMAISAGGIIANYAQMGVDIGERSKVKNPLTPPGTASIVNAGELVFRLMEQKKLTAADLDDFARAQISAYRTVKAAGAKALGVPPLGGPNAPLATERARQDNAWLSTITRRFGDEVGIETSRTSLGRVAKTETSPLKRELLEALRTGDVPAAKAAIAQLTAGKTNDERTAALRSLSASVKATQPIRVGAASEGRRVLFIQWAGNRLPAADLQRIRAIDQTYRRTAERAGLLKDEPATPKQVQTSAQKLGVKAAPAVFTW